MAVADVGPAIPYGVVREEEQADGGAPAVGALYRHAGWARDLPWVIQGITGDGADMSLFGNSPVGAQIGRWTELRESLDCTTVVHARQVHEATVHVHDHASPGLLVAEDADGHATVRAGLLIGVTVADCVPIYLAAPDVRAIALLHGGWRGVAAGILENGVRALARRFGADAGSLHVHLGPAICGDCFQVGPEVRAGLGLPAVSGRSHVDLRAALAQRALDCGVAAERISISVHCTRHGGSPFYSHRGGCAERQLAVLAIRSDVAGNTASAVRHQTH